MNKAEIPVVRRQAILNYLNLHGPSTIQQMSPVVSLTRSALSSYLRSLIDEHEVTVDCHIAHKATIHHYTAQVERTARQPNAKKEPQAVEPWRTVHTGTNGARPIPNQGGQGACVPRTVCPSEYVR